MIFDIIYQDDDIVVINKPYGYFVHRSGLDNNASQIILNLLRDQIGLWLYPVHRLDRKTSGVLIYALNSNVQRQLNAKFANNEVKKEYHAIVRGHSPDQLTIDYAITNDRDKLQDAVTHLSTLQKVELPISSGRYATSRYSWVRLIPDTGRMHQLRKHMSHIFHPILGDRPHGCNKQNKFFLEQYNFSEMTLHAKSVVFIHPSTGKKIYLQAKYTSEMERIAGVLTINLQENSNKFLLLNE